MVLRTVQLASALHTNRRRTGARNSDAQLLEEVTQLGDVRLACCVTDFRAAGGARCREQRCFRAGDRRLVEIDGSGPEALRRFERVAGTRDDARPHGFERFDVRGECPPRRKIATRRGKLGAAATREQRTKQQHRSAQPADQGAVRLVFHQFGAAHA